MTKILPTHEIYDPKDGEVIGTASILEDGTLSISINGKFNGVFETFDLWNLGMSYKLRAISRGLLNSEGLIEYDLDVFDSLSLEDISILDDLN